MIAANRIKTVLPLAGVTATIMVLVGVSAAQAAAPVKLIPSSRFGREVNLTEVGKGPALEDVCTALSKDECGPGTRSSIPGGFEFPESVAGTTGGNFYVTDRANHRVQELTATGEFVLMFGQEVNETTGGNLCTALSKDVCKAGIKGGAAGQFGQHAASITVDPVSGDIYVAEFVGGGFGERVQKFTAEGAFILEIGKGVNEKTKGNLCTEKEVEEKTGVQCIGPAESVPGSTEGAFNFSSERGNIVAIGGGEDLLYVGDENRVQEFKPEGTWKAEIPLSGIVGAMAIDQKTGDLYFAYGEQNTVHKLDAEGNELAQFEVQPRNQGRSVFGVSGIAVDASGHIAVSANEEGPRFGALYDAATGLPLPGFTIPEGTFPEGIGFNGKGELLAAAVEPSEVLSYTPKDVAELLTGAAPCVPGGEHETSVAFACTLAGEVDPWGVKETEVGFEWGRTTALGEKTKPQMIPNVKSEGEEESLVNASAPIQARPNETFYYQLTGEDLNVKHPEALTGKQLSFFTPLVAPKVVGEPSAPFAKDASAVMLGELNPENASTEYFFEYAPELKPGENPLASCPGIKHANCPGVASTPGARSAVYGRIATTMEATGLQPVTTYHYRLAASNEQEVEREVAGKKVLVKEGGQATGAEGTFTTAAAVVPQATTGATSTIGATSATVSGTVDPDGLPATYAFELGVYEGASTQYGIVFSGPAGTGSVPIEESLALTGLQPGTTYAYRIAVSSGYVTNESHTLRGAPSTFTTGGLPSVLVLPTTLAQLPIPAIAFPTTAVPTTKTLTNAQKLANALKACRRHGSRRGKRRATCEKRARKRYRQAGR